MHRDSILAVAVVLLIFGASAGYVYSQNRPQAAMTTKPVPTITETRTANLGETVNVNLTQFLRTDINLALTINVTKPDGQLVSSHYFPHDLLTNNFYYWLEAFLLNAQSSQSVSVPAAMKDTANAICTNTVADDCAEWGLGSTGFTYTTAGQGGLIEIGDPTSQPTAARTDYNLATAYQSYFDTSSSCTTTSSVATVSIVGSEAALTTLPSGSNAFYESGLFFEDAGASPAYWLMAHDSFSSVAVTAGNVITVSYTLSLNNAGFNYNLCLYLASFFTQPNGAGSTVKSPTADLQYTDTSNRVVGYSALCGGSTASAFSELAPSNPTTTTCTAYATGQTQNILTVEVGTGSAGSGGPFTPTSYAVDTPYASNYVLTTQYDGAGDSYIVSTITLATGATINEAAIYLTLPNGCITYSPSGAGSCGSYGPDTIMLLAMAFTGVAIPNGGSIGILFEVSG